MRFGAIHAAARSHVDWPITGKQTNKMTTNRRDFLLRAGQLGVLGRTKALNLFADLFAARPNVETRDTTNQNRSLNPSGSETKEISRDKSPSIEEYASIEALSQGQPVYGFDYMMYVYGVSPDLFPATCCKREIATHESKSRSRNPGRYRTTCWGPTLRRFRERARTTVTLPCRST
jgi:hypothetical protein